MTEGPVPYSSLELPPGFDLDVFLVETGLRQLGKLEQVAEMRLDGVRAPLHDRGLATRVVLGPTPGFAVIYLARDASLLDEAEALEADQRLRNDAQRRARASTRVGELLGYAPCCVAQFVSGPQDDEAALARLGIRVEQDLPALTNFFPRNFAPLGFLPCRPDCPAALQHARRVAERLARELELPVQTIAQSLAGVVIWMRGPIFAHLQGTTRVGPRSFDYRAVHSAITDTAFPDLPPFRDRVETLRVAVELLVRGSRFTLERDGVLSVEDASGRTVGRTPPEFDGRVAHFVSPAP